MGRASIISEIGEGKYSIRVEHDTIYADQQIDKLQLMIDKLELRITEEEAKPPEQQDLLALGGWRLRQETALARIVELTEARDVDFDTDAWCADLSTGITGRVGTIEIGTEYQGGVNIRPNAGPSGNAAHDSARDGIAHPFRTLPLAMAMVNYGILPGAQKWRPTYRYATISNLNTSNDTCRVTFLPAFSSQQNLDVNQSNAIDGVPIEYMTCNAAAFQDGDVVIVEFEDNDWSSPKVIGFKQEPKSCGYNLKLTAINGVAFPEGGNSYQLRILQEIPRTVEVAGKGFFTEDFTVVGEGACDAKGVAQIEPLAGVDIDPDEPLLVAVKNHTKWTYFTTDWKGSVPDYGYEWDPVDYFNDRGMTPRPADWDDGPYDFLVDVVQFVVSEDIDLRDQEQVSFVNEAGQQLSGYEVEFSGIKFLRRDHTHYFTSDIPNFVQPNYSETELDPAQYVWQIMDVQDRELAYIQWPYQYEVPGNTSPQTCNGGDSGLAYQVIGNQNPYAPASIWEEEKNDPFIKSDRLGRNLSYSQTEAEIYGSADWDCYWIWAEYVGGYLCVNWVTGATKWLAYRCQPGEAVEGGGPCDFAGILSCGVYMTEQGEYFKWEMVAIDADSI